MSSLRIHRNFVYPAVDTAENLLTVPANKVYCKLAAEILTRMKEIGVMVVSVTELLSNARCEQNILKYKHSLQIRTHKKG